MRKTLILFVAVTTSAVAFAGNKTPQPFDEVSMIFETNVTDGDAEIVIEVETFEGLSRLFVRSP